MNKTILTILVALFSLVVLADDFKTIDGKEYKNAKVSRVEPDGIVLITKSGISKVYFTELSEEVQQRFQYDPQKAAEYRAAEVEAAKQRLQEQQHPTPAATTAPDAQERAARQGAVSGNANAQSRDASQKHRQQEQELRSAQNETEAIKAEARGDYFTAKIIRIRAGYERRIKEAMNAGNRQLANELEKQAEVKMIDALTREQLRQGH